MGLGAGAGVSEEKKNGAYSVCAVLYVQYCTVDEVREECSSGVSRRKYVQYSAVRSRNLFEIRGTAYRLAADRSAEHNPALPVFVGAAARTWRVRMGALPYIAEVLLCV